MIVLEIRRGELVLIEENMCRILTSMRETSPCRILHSGTSSPYAFVNVVIINNLGNYVDNGPKVLFTAHGPPNTLTDKVLPGNGVAAGEQRPSNLARFAHPSQH
jgi:hypothetical protein